MASTEIVYDILKEYEFEVKRRRALLGFGSGEKIPVSHRFGFWGAQLNGTSFKAEGYHEFL